MIIGVDFDNTVVCYDRIFHQVALERGLIPTTVPASKQGVRDYLRSTGRENDWIEMQGHVYGACMRRAAPFPGALDFFQRCRASNIQVYIISHRTLHPFSGPAYDLHAAAGEFLDEFGFFDPRRIGLLRERVFFELTKEAKIRRMLEIGCTHFVDDLIEFLTMEEFPAGIDRILFDPNGNHPADPRIRPLRRLKEIPSWDFLSLELRGLDFPVRRAASWDEITSMLLDSEPAPISDRLLQSARRLMINLGKPGDVSLEALEGGTNNRVFRLDHPSGRYLLKAYFHHPDDPRDRLGVEYAFSSFAWESGIRSLPRPLASDMENHLGLYEFVPGRKLFPAEISDSHVEAAIRFYRELNQNINTPAALAMPRASESCFTTAEHLRCGGRRIERLLDMDAPDAIHRAALDFIRTGLRKAWEEILDGVRRRMSRFESDPDESLPPPFRRLSPSDFGFHNALVMEDGRLAFIDFEYAGWDDPAKLVCDFFGQPEVPAPMRYFREFSLAVAGDLPEPERQVERMNILLPVHRFKWCCILLNDFLPIGRHRRQFAMDLRAESLLEEQLSKAREAVRSLSPEMAEAT
ncbi:aminoglycoside phosphotransferase family protein [bacterium]|nr:aminoglycoside phosphotransferase family protein [bacterium]